MSNSIVLLTLFIVSSATDNYTVQGDYYDEIANILQNTTTSAVYTKRSRLYYMRRKVHNGLCDDIFPN